MEGYTGTQYITDEDIQEVMNWPLHYIMLILETMGDTDTDSGLCPWCIVLSNQCHSCGYASRHGKCSNISSTYSRITLTRITLRRTTPSIIDIPNICQLQQCFKKKADEILDLIRKEEVNSYIDPNLYI